MNLLLDTHTLLWHAEGSDQMSAVATASLADPGNDLYLSTATLWEVAIKLGLGKLALSASFGEFMNRAISAYGLTVLPITVADCAEYAALPFPVPSHRDPFDRMIIVHARQIGASVVGNDARFDAYGVVRLW